MLRLLVVSTGPNHCAGIDLASGALVRAWAPSAVDQRLRPYDVVSVMIAEGPDLGPEPSGPEGVAVAWPPKLSGRLTGRRAQRLIRPLLHPEHEPLLGFQSPALPLWDRRPDHPSIALVEPQQPLVVSLDAGKLSCRFTWQDRRTSLPCTDPRLAASFARSGRQRALLTAGALLVVALGPPVDGHCHKVVESVVPPR
jgi:hypothetical protein